MKIHFISAGAGSGKTRRLTEILFEKLSKGTVRSSGVLATTFTRKAAAELRERVRYSLLEGGAFELASTIGQARIGTVNSVCGDFLDRFSFEAGLSPNLRVLEESQARALLQQAVDEVVDASTLGRINTIAARLGIENWNVDLERLVSEARANDIDTAALAQFARENSRKLTSFLPSVTRENLSDLLLGAIKKQLPRLEAAETSKKVTREYIAIVADMRARMENGTARWADWAKLSKEAPEVALKPLAAPIAEVANRYGEHAQLHSDIETYIASLFAVCADSLQIYAQTKRELGALDFTDQERLFLGLLDQPRVRACLSQELELVLVDEFQDTSPLQLALFLKLAALAKETYWVGDGKQAIYGFRGCDSTLIQEVLAFVPKLGGSNERLTTSRRSRPSLVNLVNSVFTSAFASQWKADDVKLTAERREQKGTAFENWVLQPPNRDARAHALAGGIEALILSERQVRDPKTHEIRKIRWSDVAVLARSNDAVQTIASALRMRGVPWATEQAGLLATPEARLALACLRRLNDRGDSVAAAEIIALTECSEPEVWLQDRLACLKRGEPADLWRCAGERMHPVLTTIEDLRTSLSGMTPREAVVSVITRCGLAKYALQWRDEVLVGRLRIANLEALVGQAESYEDACRSSEDIATVAGFLLWLGDQQANKTDLLAQPAVDAVCVLTHHGAKGLEWPVVVLCDLESTIRDRVWGVSAESRSPLAVEQPLQGRFIHYWPWPFGQQRKVALADSVASSEIGQRYRQRALEEEKRLLYVSMTRARDLLIFARSGRKASGDQWLDAPAAPWLLQSNDSEFKTPDGEVVPYAYREIHEAPPGRSLRKSESVYWFRAGDKTDRLRLFKTPSKLSGKQARVEETVQIGSRIGLSSGADMVQVGNAIHACIAAMAANENAALPQPRIASILKAFGVSPWLDAGAVRNQITEFCRWRDKKWPGAPAKYEVPFESLSAEGQISMGRIDLLIEIDGGWVLIDHKSNPGGIGNVDELAQRYAGQLDAYSTGIERATKRPVRECWLFMPVAAAAARIAIT